MSAASKRYLGLIHRLPCEEWRSIPGWAGLYEASNLGRVRSLNRLHRQLVNGEHKYEGRVLVQLRVKQYLAVTLAKPGMKKRSYVHRLVLMAFRGLPQQGHEACHCNGNPHDNRLENLRWDTRSGNQADKRKHGTAPLGDGHHNSKLTAALVREIRASSIPSHEWARRTGFHVMTISKARRGLTWRDV